MLYASLFLLAVATRFWDLGSRALHHDESLHAYFSWIYAEGFGYQHNPLMHGPFLFHLNALLYLLFGATDYVSRIGPALAGVIVVMLPWFLRGERLLGRWGALIASLLLLLSPSILFYSRFIRHDLYALVGTFALFIAIARYVERPEPRWAVLGGVATGFLLTTKEVSFIAIFIFVCFAAVAIAFRSAPVLLGIAAGAGLTFLAVAKALSALDVAPLPGIPWQNPTNSDIWAFTIDLIQHPLVVALIGVALLALTLGLWALDRRRDPTLGWVEGVLGDAPPGTTSAALRELLIERYGLLAGILSGLVVFITLYSSLFTNLGGLATGTAGALGYWLGQHGVQRGEQPWYYYLLLLPQYEVLAALIFPGAAALTLATGVKRLRQRVDPGHRFYVRCLLLTWSILVLAILSWAGEKMPWLLVHIALPLTLLVASYLGQAVERITRDWNRTAVGARRGMLLLAGTVLTLVAAQFLAIAWGSAGPYVTINGQLVRALRPVAADHWWTLILLPGWLLIVGILIGAWCLGRTRALLTGLTAGVVAVLLFQSHVAWRMAYQEGDVPKDMLIYVQSTPDIPMVTEELRRLSWELTGGMGLEVWYDSGTQWPFNWYLRDFTNRRYFGTQLPQPMSAPVVLVMNEFLTPAIEQSLSGYTYQEYPMRWWFPEEETYRRFAIAPELKNEWRQNYQNDEQPPYSPADVAASVASSLWSLHEPQQQADMFRMLAYRELPAPIGSVRFRVYVRNDLLPYLQALRYN